jgi:hypothetical protein
MAAPFPEVMDTSGSCLTHYATRQNVTGLNPVEIIAFFNLPNPSSCIMALELTQLLIEMSTRSKADNPTTIYKPIVLKVWDPL